jgi:phosphoenolpyruvate carboxylase
MPSPRLPHTPLLDATLAAAAPACSLATGRELSIAIRDLCAQAGDSLDHPAWTQATNLIASLPPGQLGDILRFTTARFHLLNQAEQVQISRINRERALAASPEKPRPDSLLECMSRLKKEGLDAAGIRSLIARLDVQPTLTAHPTEARRRSVLDNLVKIAGHLQQLAAAEVTPLEHRDAQRHIDALVRVLLATDDVRPKRLEVSDEVKNGIFFLRSSIWRAIPRLMRQLADAASIVFGENALDITELPALIRYRTWIGGDRDGNPRVTAEVTAHTLAAMRGAAIELWSQELLELKQELTLSRRCVHIPDWFIAYVDAAGTDHIIEATSLEQRQHEPIRILLMQMQGRVLNDPTYDGNSLLKDLLAIRDALYEMGLPDIARGGKLGDSIIRARAFGLHLATVDLRQHSRVHEVAVAELLAMAGVCTNYSSLDESQRVAILRQELAQPRPLRPFEAPLSEATAELMQTLAVARTAITNDRRSIRSFIISMTHGVSDMLEVLLLMKEAGLAKVSHDSAGTPRLSGCIHVVPLLETIDDLSHGEPLVSSMLDEPLYRSYVNSLIPEGLAPELNRPMQEIMLGYSDSNKDGGFFMANLALDSAQQSIAHAITSRGLLLRYFHGRGGTIGRGGGRAGRAILSSPAPARTGRIRFTEQGEIISFRYALPSIAERHLEQIVHASLLASNSPHDPQPPNHLPELLDRLASRSMSAYRSLIDDPEFWHWFSTSSPISAIAGFPIASRPVMRALGSAQDSTQSAFDQLRAIPWVFSWIQMRCLAPGWFGLGTALSEATDAELELLATEYRQSTWLSTVLDNAAGELARVRIPIARRYASAHPAGTRFFKLLHDEFDRTTRAVLRINGHANIGDESPVIARSIQDRNPWTDVLNLIQIDLLNRRRAATDADKPVLDQLLLQSVSALAAAMQSTG